MTITPNTSVAQTLAGAARNRIHNVDRPGLERFHDPEHLDEIAGRLAGISADPSSPVVVLVDGEPDEPELLLASIASGRPVIPVNANLHRRRLIAAIDHLCPVAVISTQDRSIEGVESLSGWALSGARVTPFDPDPAMPAIGAFTSGTTGIPRAYLRGQGAMVDQARLRMRVLQIVKDDRCVIFSPPSFTGALNNLVMAIANGATTFLGLERRLGKERIRDVLDDLEATYTSITPSFFRHLVSERRDAEGFGSLRWIHLSGEPIRAADVALFNSINNGKTRLQVTWGSTEAGTLTCGELEPALADRTGPLPVGNVLPGVEVIVVDDDCKPVADGNAGRILVRSGNLSVTEPVDPIQTRRITLPDGLDPERPWLDTSDAGWKEIDGRIVISGRNNLDLKIKGVRVDGADLERRISTIRGVRDVLVLAVPLSDDQATLGVAIEGSEDSIGLVRAELDVGIPAERHALVERFDSLPCNESSKIDRGVVRELFVTRIEEKARTDQLPRRGTESLIADAWQAALGIKRPGRSVTLDELGIDSLGRLRILVTMESQYGLTIPASDMSNARTIRDQARVVRLLGEAVHQTVFPIRTGDGPIVAVCPGVGGHAWVFGPLIDALRVDVTAIGIEWSDAETLERLEEYAAAVASIAGGRPVIWIGYSAGAAVAWKLSQHLQAMGGSTPGVILLDGDLRPSWRFWKRGLLDRLFHSSIKGEVSALVESRLRQRSLRGRRLFARLRSVRGDTPTLLIETDPRLPLKLRWRRLLPLCGHALLEGPHLEMLRPPIDPRLVEMINEALAAWTETGPNDEQAR